MGNSIIKNSRNFIVKVMYIIIIIIRVYVCYTYSIPIAAWSED